MIREIARTVTAGLIALVLSGCVEEGMPGKQEEMQPAGEAPEAEETVQETALEEEVAAEPSLGTLADGLVLATSFTEGIFNNVPSIVTIRPEGTGHKRDEGKFGYGCRLQKGATLCVPTLPMTPAGTWALWVYPDKEQPEKESRIMDANAYGMILRGTKLSVVFNDGSPRSLPGPDVPPETWTHLAMTWGDGSLKLYVNGSLHGQRVISGPPASRKRKLFIGSRWTGSSKAFSGIIDEFAIYDRAITDEEAAKLSSQGLK